MVPHAAHARLSHVAQQHVPGFSSSRGREEATHRNGRGHVGLHHRDIQNEQWILRCIEFIMDPPRNRARGIRFPMRNPNNEGHVPHRGCEPGCYTISVSYTHLTLPTIYSV